MEKKQIHASFERRNTVTGLRSLCEGAEDLAEVREALTGLLRRLEAQEGWSRTVETSAQGLEMRLDLSRIARLESRLNVFEGHMQELTRRLDELEAVMLEVLSKIE